MTDPREWVLDVTDEHLRDLVDDDEVLLSVAKLETGPSDRTLTLLLLLTPFATAIAWVFRQNFVMLVTDRESRTYRATRFSPTKPKRLEWRRPTHRSSRQHSRTTVLHGDTEYRIRSGRVAVLDPSDPEPVPRLPLSKHDTDQDPTRSDPRLAVALGIVGVVATAGLIAFLIWWFVSPPDSATVAALADEEYCSGDNHGEYAAFDTEQGSVLAIGFGASELGSLDGVDSSTGDRFGRLVASRGSLAADFVLCLDGRFSDTNCSGDTAPQRIMDARVYRAESGRRANNVRSAEVPVGPEKDCYGRDQRSEALNRLLCRAVDCPVVD